jgi:hypothetical protein
MYAQQVNVDKLELRIVEEVGLQQQFVDERSVVHIIVNQVIHSYIYIYIYI